MAKTELIEYQHENTTLEAFVAYDEKKQEKRPGILIFPSYEGRGPLMCERAKLMSDWGYVGFAMDLYGKGVLGKNPEESRALMRPFLDDRSFLLTRMQACMDVVKNHPLVDSSQMAAFGFCFGGVCVLDLARNGMPLKGVVSIHGVLDRSDKTPHQSIHSKVLALHAHEDPMVPPEQVLAFEKEMTEAKADWQVHVYGNTFHAFTNPSANDLANGLLYSKSADKRAFKSLQNFLEEIFYQK